MLHVLGDRCNIRFADRQNNQEHHVLNKSEFGLFRERTFGGIEVWFG